MIDKHKKMVKKIAAVLTVAILFLVGTIFYYSLADKKDISVYENRISYFDSGLIKKENDSKIYNFILADTLEERIQGLSREDFLVKNVVMLFDFNDESPCGIWMKDMKFPIDIIWLDNSFNVIEFKENVSPKTYPAVFSPLSSCRYVIEANQWFVKENQINIGDKAIVDFINLTLYFAKSLPRQ